MDEYFVEEKSTWDKLLDFLVFLAVFAVTVFLILELVANTGKVNLNAQSVTDVYYYVNMVVFAIFIADLVRLWRASSGIKDFFHHNWLDVLATIPFSLIVSLISGIPSSSPAFEVIKFLRVTKLAGFAKVQKLSRISKIGKEFKAASHLKKEGEDYQKKHRL